jgi:hypothetical protein
MQKKLNMHARVNKMNKNAGMGGCSSKQMEREKKIKKRKLIGLGLLNRFGFGHMGRTGLVG